MEKGIDGFVLLKCYMGTENIVGEMGIQLTVQLVDKLVRVTKFGEQTTFIVFDRLP